MLFLFIHDLLSELIREYSRILIWLTAETPRTGGNSYSDLAPCASAEKLSAG